jgi:uncharacterized membrane protein
MPEAALTLAETTLPPWVVLPLAGAVLILIARHVLRVQVSETNTFRRRVRIINGLVMMFTAALLAYALGIAPVVVDPKAHPADARTYVLVWTIIVGLLTITVMMAAADAVETMRVAARLRRELRSELAGGTGRARVGQGGAGAGGDAGGDRARG